MSARVRRWFVHICHVGGAKQKASFCSGVQHLFSPHIIRQTNPHNIRKTQVQLFSVIQKVKFIYFID